MDFNELLTKRRSIRDFQEKEVPLSLVREMIQETRLAPTASNRQPCQFIVIRDRALIARLSVESKGSLLTDLARDPDLPIKQYEAVLRDEAFNVFYNAPCLVLVIGPTEVRSLDVDCGLTVAYLMFSAACRGLGTCWIGLGSHIRDAGLLDKLGVPEGFRIVAPVILGYPIEIPPVSERRTPEILRVI